jgi:hypothetical protein
MNKNVVLAAVIGLLIIIVVVMFNRINELKDNIRVNDTNISALNDTLKEYKTKNGTIVAEKEAYYSSLKELEKVNKNLYNDVKRLEKELKIKTGTVQVVTVQGQVITHYDTVFVQQEKLTDSITKISVSSNNKDSVVSSVSSAELKLYHTCDSLYVTDYSLNSTFSVDNLKLTIITGYKKQGLFKPNTQYVSSIITNDERFKISGIDSWINKDFEKKRYLSLKPGLFVGGFYDPFYKHFSLGIGFGLTVQYIK